METGTWIWNRLSAPGGVAFEQIVVELVQEFAVDRDTADRDVRAFVDELRENRLVDVRR